MVPKGSGEDWRQGSREERCKGQAVVQQGSDANARRRFDKKSGARARKSFNKVPKEFWGRLVTGEEHCKGPAEVQQGSRRFWRRLVTRFRRRALEGSGGGSTGFRKVPETKEPKKMDTDTAVADTT